MITSRFAHWVAAPAMILLAALSAGRVSAQQQITLVSPDNSAITKPSGTSGLTVIFTVSSQLQQSTTRQLTLSCTGQVTSCTHRSEFRTFTYAMNDTVTFTTLATGTGSIVLTAMGSTSSDQGSFIVTVQPGWGVAVTPDAGTEPTRPANSGGYTASFSLQNTGANQDTWSFSCAATGSVVCGTPPAPVTRAGNLPPVTVNMPYSLGGAVSGPHTLTLTATSTTAHSSDAGSFTVPVAAVSVIPDGQITATRFANTAYSESFTLLNLGSVSTTFSFACSATGGIVCKTVPAPVTIGPGQTTVTMPDSTGAAGTGTLTLTASGSGVSDPGSYTIPVAAVLSSVDMTNGLILDNRYLLQVTATTYDAGGRITQVTDARNQVISYQYDANQCYGALTKVTRVHDASGTVDLVTDIACNTTGFVSSVKDEAGTFRYFFYDTYGRLDSLQNHNHARVKAYGYSYSRTSPNWTFNAASPNAVVESTFVQHSPTMKAVVSTVFIDGLGRSIQAVVQDGTNYHVTATQYDLMGRSWRTWKPYTRSGTPAYDAAFAANATSFYNAYHSATTANPYVETLYRADPLGRVNRVIPEYITTPAAYVLFGYGVDAVNAQGIAEVTDESGKKHRTFRDIFGNAVRSILGSTAPESTVTQFAYNVLGQRVQATDPRGLVTSYVLNTRGLQTSRTSPDAGIAISTYDKTGNLRFAQDANQAAAPGGAKVYFTSYDFAGRPLRSGLAAATFSSLNPDITETIENDANCPTNCLVVRQYDAKPSIGGFPWSRFAAQITPALVMNNVAGRLAAVASQSDGAWQATLYSYDADGHVIRRYIFTEGNGGASVLTAVNTSVTDSLDLRGAILRRADTIGTSYFYQWYDYNGRGLLAKMYASTSNPNTKPTTPDDTNSYRPSGLPDGYQFQGSLFVPIRYTIREQTQQIGDPVGQTYPFSARYVYQANGVVDTAEFYSGGSPSTQKRYRWTFGTAAYDALNRIKKADYSFWNLSLSSWTASPNYGLAALTYDLSGNLQTLQRRNDAGTVIDNLTYNYVTGTNRLGSLSEAAGATTTIPWDAEAGSFGYDANGNVTSAPDPYFISTVIYDPANLPLSITAASGTTTFRYDHAGQRITKQKTGQDTQIYLRDDATTLGVFNLNGSGGVTGAYFNLTWDGRVIGRQTVLPIPATRTYDHFDALGSVRSVVSTTGTVQESYDYEPWGLLMAGRSLTTATPTKEGFTGKERDAETGLDYFGARYFMAAIGRWASVDPLADQTPGWSGYNYVLDNPLALVDPTGLATCRAGSNSGSSGEESGEESFACLSQVWFRLFQAFTGTTSGDMKNAPLMANMSPIYDKQGNFLGTDDQGQAGDPIIMDRDKFHKGMTHDEAMSAGTTDLGALKGHAAWNNFLNNLSMSVTNPNAPTVGLRLPDYLAVNVNIAIPNPWTGTLIGWSGTASVDRYGDVFFSPLGVGVGKSATLVSGSVTVNWLDGWGKPSREKVANFLSGHGFNATIGYLGGVSRSYTPGSGWATGFGFVSPQIGASYNYSFKGGNVGCLLECK